jgi:hypothetical protein
VENRIENDDVVYQSEAGEENYLEFEIILGIAKLGLLNLNYKK